MNLVSNRHTSRVCASNAGAFRLKEERCVCTCIPLYIRQQRYVHHYYIVAKLFRSPLKIKIGTSRGFINVPYSTAFDVITPDYFEL